MLMLCHADAICYNDGKSDGYAERDGDADDGDDDEDDGDGDEDADDDDGDGNDSDECNDDEDGGGLTMLGLCALWPCNCHSENNTTGRKYRPLTRDCAPLTSAVKPVHLVLHPLLRVAGVRDVIGLDEAFELSNDLDVLGVPVAAQPDDETPLLLGIGSAVLEVGLADHTRWFGRPLRHHDGPDPLRESPLGPRGALRKDMLGLPSARRLPRGGRLGLDRLLAFEPAPWCLFLHRRLWDLGLATLPSNRCAGHACSAVRATATDIQDLDVAIGNLHRLVGLRT
eukprot:9488397-Pyramimonas_sp.AAC.1